MSNVEENIQAEQQSNCFARTTNDSPCRPSFRRAFAFPSSETFTIPPIAALVQFYLRRSNVSVDPFARNTDWATYTNDLNPNTSAEFHLPADEFLRLLVADGAVADLIIFDPPYSLRQSKECYAGFGREFLQADAQSCGWANEKKLCAELLAPAGVFIHFGWHSNGFGAQRGFELEQILLVAHGQAHHDTICTVERKLENYQTSLQFAA